MAVTSIWPIKGRVDNVIKYAMNPEKTTADLSELHAIDGVVEYASNELKTEKRMFVTCIGCTSEETAAQEFMETKRLYGKFGGRVCYHGYQSFAADEVDAKTAHEIGVELANNLWGDRFQVVVATHLNTGHYHNHFVINSVSDRDGYKFYNSPADYQAMKEESDRLCREHGLSVIKHPEGKKKNYAEWQAEKNGEYTVRGSIREAIDVAIRGSVNIDQFRDAMDQMGYIIDTHGKYPKIKHIGAPRFMRFMSLGPGYDLPEIYDRILDNDRPEYPDIPEQESPQQVFDGESAPVSGMGHTATYRCFIRAIEITMTRPETNRHMYFLMQNEHRQFESYKVQFRIAAENKLETDVDLLNFKVKTMEKLAGLTDTRKDLRNALKRAERSGDVKEISDIRFKLETVARQIKDCRDELKAVDEIAERSGIMKEKLQIIAEEKFRGKENTNDEHIRRSGRSGPENDTRRN